MVFVEITYLCQQRSLVHNVYKKRFKQTCSNVLHAEDANSDVAADIPLLCLAVRLTAVINKSCQVPL